LCSVASEGSFLELDGKLDYYCVPVHIWLSDFLQQNQSLLGYLMHSFCLESFPYEFHFVVAVRMHPSTFLSTRHVVNINLTFFIKSNSCSQRLALSSKDITNKLFIRQLLVKAQSGTVLQATQSSSQCRGLTAPVPDLAQVILDDYIKNYT
jgi:hypothetical protein